jgi:hypothetical protein
LFSIGYVLNIDSDGTINDTNTVSSFKLGYSIKTLSSNVSKLILLAPTYSILLFAALHLSKQIPL